MGWTPLLISHVLAAGLSVLLGAVQLWRRPRGDGAHRTLGRVWVVLIVWAAISSYWIRHLNDGAFSWLHVLSVVTVLGAANGVFLARRGNLIGHRMAMVSTWIGAVVALVFAVAVGKRLIPTYAVEQPLGLVGFIASIVALSGLIVWLSIRAGRKVDPPPARPVDPERGRPEPAA